MTMTTPIPSLPRIEFELWSIWPEPGEATWDLFLVKTRTAAGMILWQRINARDAEHARAIVEHMSDGEWYALSAERI